MKSRWTDSWTDSLPEDVYNRLANCRSRKSDILTLANAKWNYIKKSGKYAKEDALIQVLELLDCNCCDYELTMDEYNEILDCIY